MPALRKAATLSLLFMLCVACGDEDPVAEIHARHAVAAYAETLDPLRELLKERPQDPELNYLYGVALARTGQPGLAIWALRRARESEKWADEAGLELAADALAARNYRVAEEAATEVLERKPDDLEALRIRAEARLEDKQDVEGALADFDRILALAPEDFGARMSRFATLLALERAEDAEAALDDLEKHAIEDGVPEGERAQLCAARAVFAGERREIEKATEGFEACLSEFPTVHFVIEEAVRFFDESGQTSRATEVLQAALELAPESTSYRRQLAERLRTQDRSAEARDLLLEGTRLASEQAVADSWTALAEHHANLDELPEAVDAFEHAAALVGPLSQQQILAYADLLAAAEMNERALEVAKDLEADSYRQLIRARVLLNEHRPSEALALYQDALKLWPDNAIARYYAARAAEQAGDFEASVEQYRQSIRADTAATDAGLRLARMLVAEGDAEEALSALSQHLKTHPGDPDGTLFAIELAGRGGDRNQALLLYSQVPPSSLRALAAAKLAAATAVRDGPAAAVAFLRADRLLDFTDSRDVEALRSFVVHSLKTAGAASARKALEAASSLRPDDSKLLEIRGLVLENGGKLDEAEAAYRRALEIDPNNPHAVDSLGRLTAESGRSEEALSLLCDSPVKRVPAELEPSLRCSEQLLALGRPAKAIEALESALREFPWSAPVAMTLARLYLDQKDPDSAERLARRAVRFGGGRKANELLEAIQKEGQVGRAAGDRASHSGQPAPGDPAPGL